MVCETGGVVIVDIITWLSELNLNRYAETFRSNEIGLDILPDLNESDLSDLGIPLGDRKRIMRGIRAFKGEPVPLTTHQASPDFSSEAERRHLTVMFVDLVGSTQIASEIDPEEMRDLIRAYQNAVAGEVLRFGGYVAKFMGDGVLCYFGFPAANEDDPERAIMAARAIIKATALISTTSGNFAGVRTGIASGIVVVGEIVGEAEARERDVVGETPNIAARLQSIAEPGQIVIAQTTQQLVRQVFRTTEIALPDLKGISGDLRAFLVDDPLTAEDRFAATTGAEKAPIVGRKAEMDRLYHGWTQVAGGKAVAVILTGEPGIGKSRLVHAFYDRVGDGDHARTVLFCSPHHTQTALYPIIFQLEKDAGILPEDADEIAFEKLRSLLPELLEKDPANGRLFANLLGRKFDAHLGALEMAPKQMRARTIELLTSYLLMRPNGAPSLIIVEDIHWIDQTTIEVLLACLSLPDARKTFFLMVGRSDGTPAALSAVIDDQINLTRLDKVSAHAIVMELTKGKGLPDRLFDEIFRKTDGVPLFVQELTKMIIESDKIEETDTEYRLTGPISSLAIPSSLHDSLMARLDRLEHAKKTAQIAACIGRTFDFDILSDLTLQSPAEMKHSLDELIEAELVATPEAGSSIYSFCHALVCDAAYESLLKSQRRRIHARVAEHMERQSASLETLAYHHEAAGHFMSAAKCLLGAGRNALRISAAVEAIDRFQKGIDLLETLPSTGETKHLEMLLLGMLGIGFMQTKSWGAVEVDQAYSKALKLVDETDNVTERIWVIWGAWVYQQVHGQIGESQSKARRAMEIAQEGGSDDALLVAHVMLLQAAFYEGRWKDALEHGAQIERFYDAEIHGPLRDAYSLDLMVVWYVHGCQAHWMLGNFQQADEMRARARAFSEEIDHMYSRLWVSVWSANLDLLNGDFAHIQKTVPAAIQSSETHGFDYTARLGNLILTAGQLNSVSDIEELDQAIKNFQVTGAGISIPYFLALKAQALLRTNDTAQARTVCEDAIAIIDKNGERWPEPLAYCILGDILASPGINDKSGAEAAYRRSAERARHDHAIVWQAQAELGILRIHVANGDQALAHSSRQNLEQSRSELERSASSGHSRTIAKLIAELNRND